MILTSDIELRHPLWERADNELHLQKGTSIFNRLVDIYVLACAIGIRDDKIIADSEIQNPLVTVKTIGRNTHRENSDIRAMLEFMLQNILLNSKTLNIDEDERIKLAFNPDYDNKKIKAADLLTGFANYGITKIFENISSSSALVATAELYKYFESMANARYDEILETITLEDLGKF